MSSRNLFYTIQYAQPDEYHFSHDSIFLARRVFELLQSQTALEPIVNVLDLCSGCGVVGIDYLCHLINEEKTLPSSIDFLEVQDIYQKYFIENISQIKQLNTYQYLSLNYDQVTEHTQLKQKYNLILSNPPYFKLGIGALSPSDFKNRCRFFIDSNLEKLVLALEYLLAPGGRAFVLLKDLAAHGIDTFEEIKKIPHHLSFKKIEKVRETDLYEFQSTSN